MPKPKIKSKKKVTLGKPTVVSVITKLSKSQRFYISLIAGLFIELEKEKLITPMQKNQCSEYILEKMQAK